MARGAPRFCLPVLLGLAPCPALGRGCSWAMAEVLPWGGGFLGWFSSLRGWMDGSAVFPCGGVGTLCFPSSSSSNSRFRRPGGRLGPICKPGQAWTPTKTVQTLTSLSDISTQAEQLLPSALLTLPYFCSNLQLNLPLTPSFSNSTFLFTEWPLPSGSIPLDP